MIGRFHLISPKVRKFEGPRVRRLFSPKVRKSERKVLQLERNGSVVRRSGIPKSWNMQICLVILDGYPLRGNHQCVSFV